MPRKPLVPAVEQLLAQGTIVRLRSGGPKMTVKAHESQEAEVFCLWFDGKRLETGSFAALTLIPVEEKNKKKKAKE